MPEGHEGREIYGLIKDEHPDKGRALGRLEEKQHRIIDKAGGPQQHMRPGSNPESGQAEGPGKA